MKIFATIASAIVVHNRNLIGRLISLRRRVSFTIATADVIGVTNRNQRACSSSSDRCGQNGIVRSMGNETTNSRNPTIAGRHHKTTGRALAWGNSATREPAILEPFTPSWERMPDGRFDVVDDLEFTGHETKNILVFRFDRNDPNYRSATLRDYHGLTTRVNAFHDEMALGVESADRHTLHEGP
jgi:hypothetical protein